MIPSPWTRIVLGNLEFFNECLISHLAVVIELCDHSGNGGRELRMPQTQSYRITAASGTVRVSVAPAWGAEHSGACRIRIAIQLARGPVLISGCAEVEIPVGANHSELASRAVVDAAERGDVAELIVSGRGHSSVADLAHVASTALQESLCLGGSTAEVNDVSEGGSAAAMEKIIRFRHPPCPDFCRTASRPSQSRRAMAD